MNFEDPNSSFSELESLGKLQRELNEAEGKLRAVHVARTWGRIQPELGFLDLGRNETQLSEWTRRELDSLNVVHHNRQSTQQAYSLEMRFVSSDQHDNNNNNEGEGKEEPRRVVFASKFRNHDVMDGDEEVEEGDDVETEYDDEDEEDEDDDDDEDDDEEAEEEASVNDDQASSSQPSYESLNLEPPPLPPPVATRTTSKPVLQAGGNTSSSAQVEYRLDVLLDSATVSPPTSSPLFELKFTTCTRHLPSETLFYDDLGGGDDEDEDDDVERGPVDLLYETCGFLDFDQTWEDGAARNEEPIASKPFSLGQQVCKCVTCGMEHSYEMHINWPLLQRLRPSAVTSEPECISERGKRLARDQHPAVYAMLGDLRRLVLLLVVSGAGNSGHVVSPLEFLFQCLLSDVFDRFHAAPPPRHRFEHTVWDVDPELTVD